MVLGIFFFPNLLVFFLAFPFLQPPIFFPNGDVRKLNINAASLNKRGMAKSQWPREKQSRDSKNRSDPR